MAGIAQTAKPFVLEPLSGLFDARSPADAVPFGIWRYLQNADTPARNKLRRAPGWEKLLTKVGYNNQDLHDQLLTMSAGAMRQPITMLYQATSTAGYSQLLAGTSKRLFALNNANGNWKILSDQMGIGLGFYCSDLGWMAAQAGNTVVLSNGYDAPVYHVLFQPSIEPGDQSVAVIADLDKIGLTLAKCVASYKGIIIFGNVVMDGERIAHRLVWSDVDRPLSWVPKAGTSAAGFQDLGYGEDVLGMEKLADSLLIYTSAGIWEAVLGGAEVAFTFTKRYSDHTAGNRCLAYRRTLVTTGSEHIYCGRDGIYRYSFYTPEPVREEWMHAASAVMYNDLAEADCNVHCAGYNAREKSVYISWAARGEICATRTLVLNTQYDSDYVLDHGFSAFCNYNPDLVKTLRDWIIEQCICTAAQLQAEDFWYKKEGTWCVAPTNASCETGLAHLFTSDRRTVEDITVEDWSQETIHPLSLCAHLGGVTMSQLCQAELAADECDAEQLFVAASAQDYCLKQIGTAYSRERCTSNAACGEYTYDGYRSIWRMGPLDMKNPSVDKLWRHLLVDMEADDAAVPGDLELRVGASYSPADPNNDRCSLRWFTQGIRKLKCPSVSGAAHLAARTRQSGGVEWPLFLQDRYLYLELAIDGMGGSASFSKLSFWLEAKKG